jgi:hypothetical protein
MKILYLFVASVILLSILSFCGTKSTRKEKEQLPEKGFAVVELFTSEGCSSCPSADEAMIRLAKEFPEHVYFLAYHVDYWDYNGWKDQYSNADYTKRQDKYVELFKLSSGYTPQVIINGEKELVGSRENQIKAEIQQELKKEGPSLIDLSAKKNGQTVSVSYKPISRGNDLLNIALVQLRASTDVKRGENQGRVLNHINIVRELRTVSDRGVSSVDFNIPKGLSPADLKVIAFVQNRDNMKISGAIETAIQ